MRQPRFANARSVRNELESARLRHAYRLAADPERHRSKDDLMRLEPSDILPRSLLKKGRRYGVFAGSAFDDLG